MAAIDIVRPQTGEDRMKRAATAVKRMESE
jgi:hypothetical protein